MSEEPQIARPLEILRPLIRKDIGEAEKASLPHYAAAGVMLWEAEVHFADSRAFYALATTTFGRSKTTIRNWMTYAREMHGWQSLKYRR